MKSANPPENEPADGEPACASLAGLSPGREMGGRYRVQALLARGGSGEIYSAHDMSLDQAVALKTLRPELRQNAEAAARLFQEFSLIRKFRHPGICCVHDYSPGNSATGDPPFFSMELLTGETLAARMAVRPWPAAMALPIWRQLAEALGTAHASGVIHGDFHPANVILVRDANGDRAVLTDFGGAQQGSASDGDQAEQTNRGVADYQAPEQAAGEAASPASDVFALGLLMYEMVAGHQPFVHDPDDPAAPMSERALPLRHLLPTLNPALDEIIQRCLLPAAEERYAGGMELAAALREITEAEGHIFKAATVPPQNRDRAAALLAQARLRLRRHEAGAARELLAAAARVDAENPQIHCALAETLAQLGFSDKARACAGRALAGAARLPDAERLWITGIYHELHQQWVLAIENFSALLRLIPDSVDCGLRLIGVFNQSGRREQGRAVLASLRLFPPADVPDPRLDLATATAARFEGDFRGSHAAALVAVRNALAQDGSILMAEGESAAGQALYNLGEFKAAAAAYQRAQAAYRLAGDRRGLSRVLLRLAEVSWSQGDIDAALVLPYESLKICRAMNDRAGASGALNFLAIVLDHQGKLVEAGDYFAQALVLAREINLPHGCATALNNLGENFRRRGALQQAAAHYAEANAIYRQSGELQGIGRTLDGLGYIALAQGRLVDAGACFAEKEKLALDSNDLSSVAYALHGRGEVHCENDELEPALHAHQEALALREKLGEKGNAAESHLALARVHLNAGRLPEAARLAEAAIEEFNAEGRRLDEARASALRSLIHIVSNEPAPARRLLARAQAATADCQDMETVLQVTLARARLERLEGDLKAALQLALDTEQRAAACGYARFAMQARRLVADINLRSGAPPED